MEGLIFDVGRGVQPCLLECVFFVYLTLKVSIVLCQKMSNVYLEWSCS